MTPPTIAFYAPLKSPRHPTPSGDRKVARLFFEAWSRAGLAPELASEFRSFCGAPDAARFEEIAADGAREAERLIAAYSARPRREQPQLWFTYHVYYKAPDHLGPRVAAALGVPYVVAEASRSQRRLSDAWELNAQYAESAIDLADVILYMTERDRPALASKPLTTQRLIPCRPFIDPGHRPGPKRPASPPFRLLTVAMMREGDKLSSYRSLAAALALAMESPWTFDIVGDGPARAEVEALFAPFGERVRFVGRIDDPQDIRAVFHRADLFVWPGVGEAYGMAYLEAKAFQTPVLAEDRPGVRDVLSGGGAVMTPKDRPDRFADALIELLSNPDEMRALGRAGRADVVAHRSLDAQAEALWLMINRLDLLDLSDVPRPASAAEIVAKDQVMLH